MTMTRAEAEVMNEVAVIAKDICDFSDKSRVYEFADALRKALYSDAELIELKLTTFPVDQFVNALRLMEDWMTDGLTESDEAYHDALINVINHFKKG